MFFSSNDTNAKNETNNQETNNDETQKDAQKSGHDLQASSGNAKRGGGAHSSAAPHGLEGGAARLPTDLFLWAAAASIALSLGLQLSGRRQDSNFVGHWAPTFLALGLYSKLVRGSGNGQTSR